MSTQHENSFLPTGAIKTPGPHYDLPYYFSFPHTTNTTFQQHNHYPHFTYEQASVMSPPKTRSGCTKDSNISLTEDWSSFVQQLRNQFQGERAHMRADRERMQEVIEGERELWDRERQIWNKERKALRTRITDLETKLLSIPDLPLNLNQASFLSDHKISLSSPKNIDISSSTVITQESGRNTDGSPFYAPAPQNPSRTFDTETASDLRVDDLAIPQETAIRVTSKELTSLDFIQKMCPLLNEADAINTIGESIDISHIQPELDSVSIRVSAVSPAFAAKALLPQKFSTSSNSQSKKVPDLTDTKNVQCDKINDEKDRSSALCSQPENKRLILFAGHTPNHPKTNFGMENDPTPDQVQSSEIQNTVPSLFEKYEFNGYSPDVRDDDNHDNDDELSEPLGLINASAQDDSFLAQLTEKLAQEALKSSVSDSSSGCKSTQIDLLESSPLSSSHDDEEIEGSILRMKPSLNFGRPFGSM
ncbi:hypothetical protein OnM2_051041 [Erysiphe neolycopersici]|uniref:Uncharacterized protein n=1 Tax=Erysiphe neolycopersici TaxID=212602 RepID=A0A420HSM7_9PEZI|nr:hypothetical protein OnM2_051041 [Erysiphe neolycopersici]